MKHVSSLVSIQSVTVGGEVVPFVNGLSHFENTLIGNV